MLDDSPLTLPFTFYSVCLSVFCFSDSRSEDVTDAGVWYTHTHNTARFRVDTTSFLRYEYERAFGAYLGLGSFFHLYFPLHLVCNTVSRLIPCCLLLESLKLAWR